MKKKILEICCGNIESALNAMEGGADRIELCQALDEGGVTPSAGMIKAVTGLLKIPVHVLIRPRGGSFCYTQTEVNSMLHDIDVCKNNGIAGIVTGALLPNGHADEAVCKTLIEHAKPLKCTFHRAFDVAADPFTATEEIIELGFERILTSGQKPTAEEGLVTITQLIKVAGDRIIIMPGSGINENNIEKIAQQTGATEFHMSLRTAKSTYSKSDNLLKSLPYAVTNIDRVKCLRQLIDDLKL